MQNFLSLAGDWLPNSSIIHPPYKTEQEPFSQKSAAHSLPNHCICRKNCSAVCFALHLLFECVFALEPKIVLLGIGPVGIENSWVVTAEGVEKLTLCKEEIVEL